MNQQITGKIKIFLLLVNCRFITIRAWNFRLGWNGLREGMFGLISETRDIVGGRDLFVGWPLAIGMMKL